MKRLKNAALGVLVLVFVVIGALSVYGLYHPDSWYDERSWTWYYSAPYTWSYNCLGYATGSMTWEWPWSGLPTNSQVDSYLATKGYKTTGTWAYIISYYDGYSSYICHFSKVTGTVWCRAKWGSLERFNHGSWNPYTTVAYGPKAKEYYK